MHGSLNETKAIPDEECDYFQAVTNLLLIAQESMEPPAFKKSFALMAQQIMGDDHPIPIMQMNTVTLTSTRRASSASKRKTPSEYETNLQTRQAASQRRAEAYAKEREEADMDLDYSAVIS
jgi:hypothetical protein